MVREGNNRRTKGKIGKTKGKGRVLRGFWGDLGGLNGKFWGGKRTFCRGARGR